MIIKNIENLAGSETCRSCRGDKGISIQRRCEEDTTFNAVLCDDSDTANTAGASIMEHCVENCLLDELNAGFLLHVLFVVLANEAIDEGASGAADCAALTDHHATLNQISSILCPFHLSK